MAEPTIKAIDFLKQLKKLDKLIENKLSEKEQWKAIATGTTAQMGGERVQSSGSLQKMADAVEKYLEIEKEIDKRIDELVDAKLDVIGVIEQLNTTEYDVLHKIYVGVVDPKTKQTIYLTFEEVADIYGKSRSWATTIHGRALKSVQKILDTRAKAS